MANQPEQTPLRSFYTENLGKSFLQKYHPIFTRCSLFNRSLQYPQQEIHWNE